MARTITRSELRSQIRELGDYENSDVFTDAILNDWIDDARCEVYDLLIDAWPDAFTAVSALSLVTGGGQPWTDVSLPLDFYKLRRLAVEVDGDWCDLRAASLGRVDLNAEPDAPETYRIESGVATPRLVVYPTVDKAYSAKLFYLPSCDRMASDAATFDGWNGYESLVRELVLLRCDQREERPLNDRMAIISRLEGKIRAAADGTDAEPRYLDDDRNGGRYL